MVSAVLEQEETALRGPNTEKVPGSLHQEQTQGSA